MSCEEYLKPCVLEHEFSKFGFRKCKGMYGRSGCYYMLVRTDNKILFASKKVFMVFDIDDNDPRIHKNRRYLKTMADSYFVVKELTEKGFFKGDENEDAIPEQISLCKNCWCMTHNRQRLDGTLLCGKCGARKEK